MIWCVSQPNEEGLRRILAAILWQNRAMLHIFRKLGFDTVHSADLGDPMVQAVKVLQPT